MEELEKLKSWLREFPLWDGAELCIDSTDAQPAGCGLFPLGLEQLSVQEDLLGNRTIRFRQQFLLRRVAVRNEAAAAWLLEFQKWVCRQSRAGLCPRFGEEQHLRAEKGRLLRADQTGTATYELTLSADYTIHDEGE